MKILEQTTPALRARILLLAFGLSATSVAFGQVTITNIPTLGGSLFGVTALNASGLVVGFSANPAGFQHAFLFGGGVLYDLGTLGGSYSSAAAINAAGQVAGHAHTAAELDHAFLLSGGIMTDLGTLGGPASKAVAINNSGQVAGDSGTGAFLYSGGAMLNLGTLGGASSSAVGINNVGQVAGNSDNRSGIQHAFLFSGNGLDDLGSFDGGYSTAAALNDAGQVVGEAETTTLETHAFLFSNGTLLDLGTIGGSYSTAYAINNSGQIIGDSYTSGDLESHGFIYQNGAMVDLGTLGGHASSAAGLNNLGQVVGQAPDQSYHDRAFLWQNGTMVDLNTLLPPHSGWELRSAKFINDAGQIVGDGLYNGGFRDYLLNTRAGNLPPVADAGGNQTVECPIPVVLDGTKSSDPQNGTLTFEWREGQVVLGTTASLTVHLPLGTHSITLKVTDSENASSENTATVSVVDSSAPVIRSATARPDVLRHPKHQMVPVTVSVSVSDKCGSPIVSKITFIQSSDPAKGRGDKTAPDWEITGPLTANLRAERSQKHCDRVYTLHLQSTDVTGNSSTKSIRVVVPKDGDEDDH